MVKTRTSLGALAVALLLFPSPLSAQQHCQERHAGLPGHWRETGNASRSDSVDLLHTRIELDLTQVGANLIRAAATHRLTPVIAGIDQVCFDLLGLTVDSITSSGALLGHTHVGELLTVDLGAALGPGDTIELTVHYHGDPVIDGSGWGGFYTAGPVVYNLGVAFESVPHSFGRAWFPCFDNFVERSTYELIVRTNGGRHAWCGGVRLSELDLGGGVLESHWLLDLPIPSYLASVAASTYAAVHDTLIGQGGIPCPVDLVAQPSDTNALKASFVHLPDAFAAFEWWFGAHRWPRVGYCLTPQGAMEHATNIAYPVSIANGSLTFEATMAHELAHHWFGDQVTCARAEEMYLNEGFAEYLSHLFLEHVYGRPRYLATVKENHHAVVWRSHLLDEGWWALADMPQDHTYGEITYNKGAAVLHTLRGYLGDTLLRTGLTDFLDQYAFRPVTTQDLRDHLTATTGVDLTDFFNDWVLQPGWAAFEVDSFTVDPTPLPGGLYETVVFIEQKQRGPAQPYSNVPMTVTFVDALGNRWSGPAPHALGPGTTAIADAPPFIPVQVLLNTDDRIAHAVTVHEDTLTTTGIVNFDLADMRFTVGAISQPAPVRVEEHWVAADTYTDAPNLYKVSPDRWWRVHMALPTGAQVSGRFTYDGRTTTNTGIDIGLMQDTAGTLFHEDSLVLLYRPDARHPWAPYADHAVNSIGSATDRSGRIDLGHVEPGDYTFGFRYSATGVGVLQRNSPWTIAPNPAQGTCIVSSSTPISGPHVLRLFDMQGALVGTVNVAGQRTEVPLTGLAGGGYLLTILGPDGRSRTIGTVQVLEGN